MPVEYAFDLYPSNDPAGKVSTSLEGSRLVRLTVGNQLTDAEFWPSLYGYGKGFLEIHGDHADAVHLHRRAYVAVIRTDTTPDRPIGGFWLTEGDFQALSTKEQKGKILRFQGDGAAAIFERYVLGEDIYAPGGVARGSYNVPHKWNWITEPPGAILLRAILEGRNAPELPFASLNTTFTRNQDTNGDDWLEEGDYQVDIGTRVDKVVADQVKRGLIVQVGAFLDVNAYRDIADYRTDRTSATFAAGKVRFEAGINILSDLPKRIASKRERTHVLMRGRTGEYQVVDTDTDGNPIGGEPWYDYIKSDTTANVDTLERMGQVYLTRLRTTSDQCKVQHLIGPGGADGEAGYDPSPDGDYWLGDLVTVHSGDGEHDYDEQPIEVASIRYFLKGGNWIAEAHLGAQYTDSRSTAANQGAVISSIIQQVATPIPFCEPTVVTEAADISFVGSTSSVTGSDQDKLKAAQWIDLEAQGVEPGDVLVAHACTDGATIIPSIPAGWTAIGAGGSGSNLGHRGAWRIYDGTEGTTQFSNANSVICNAYRGLDAADPIGTIGGANGNDNSIEYPALVLEVGDGSSWVVLFAHHNSATDVGGAAAGTTPRESARGGEHASRDTNAGVSSWAGVTDGVNSNNHWQCHAYELKVGTTSETFPGDGRIELVGDALRVKRCDDTEHWHEVGSGSPTAADSMPLFREGTLWINDDGEGWLCTDASEGAAVWVALAAVAAPHDHDADYSDIAHTHAGVYEPLGTHTGDATDAHDASAISVLDAGGNFTGADVEAVLAELDAAIGGGGHTEDHDHDGSPTQKLAQANSHETPDTDAAAGSLHHTIGAGATQAAAGNHSHGGGASDLVYDAPGIDEQINSLTDVPIAGAVWTLAGMAAGSSLVVDIWFTILNNSAATRIVTLTLDISGLFDIELATGALAASSTLMHPMHMQAVVDMRSTSLAYMMVTLEMQLLAGVAGGGDTTAAATHLHAKGWGTTATNLASGVKDLELRARSAATNAVQTLRLHHFSVRKFN